MFQSLLCSTRSIYQKTAKVYYHTPANDKAIATIITKDNNRNSASAPGAKMFIRNAAAFLLTFGSLTRNASAEVVTITRYPSTCSAIYTTGSRSVTIIQSTITVVPVPYDDAAWNGGTPFVLEIEPDGIYSPLNSRQVLQRSWLTLNGNTSTNPLSAGQYKIRNGQLVSVNGSYLSTEMNVQSQPFAITPSPGTISTTFTFKDGILNWTSPRFTNGRAQFYKLPVGLVDNAQVLAKFIGPMEPQRSWTPIALRAKPCDEVHPLSSSSAPPTGTVSVSTSITLGSMSSGPPQQYSSQSPPPYSHRPQSTSSSRAGPSISTPPPPYISSTTTSYILPSPTTPSVYPGPSSSSSSPSSSPRLPSVSTPAAYTWTTSSSVSYSHSTSSMPAQSPSSSPASSSSPPYTRTSPSPMDSSSSSAMPPPYGSQTPSISSSSSWSTSHSITFASSGSPIGPINPPYDRTTSSSSSSASSSESSSTTSMSMSSGGARTSTSLSSTSSSVVVPPSYSPPGVSSSSTTSSSRVQSSTASPAGSSSSSSSVASSPPIYSVSTPPSSTSSSRSSSSSILSESMPPIYPGEPTSSSSRSSYSSPMSSSSPSSSSSSSSSSPSPEVYPEPTIASTSTSAVNPPYYTSEPRPCPQGNNSLYIDTAGNAYTIYCNMDSEPGSYAPPVTLTFAACIQACDYDPRCGSVANLNNEVCYFKPTPVSYVPGNAQLAVRVAGNPVYPGLSSTSSWSSSWSSSVSVPPVYQPTTTSSSASSSSSSSVAQTSSSVSSIASSSWSTTSSSSWPSSSPSASSSSSEVPDQYEQTKTTTTTTTTSTSSSSSSFPSSTISEVPEEYEQTTTTTTTTTSSPMITTTTTTTSSSPSSTIPTTSSGYKPYSEYLILPSPTPCDFGGPSNQANDDDYCELDLPFDLTLYGVTARRTYPSTNGYIALNRGSSQFLAKQFPFPGTNYPESVLAAFFDDLYMYGNLTERQGIWYQIEGGKVTFEYYVARAMQPESVYHFTVAYDSLKPNTFTFRYYAVGDASKGDTGTNGAVAYVGMQGLDAQNTKKSAQYSWRETKIEPGLMVVCDGTLNSCVGALP